MTHKTKKSLIILLISLLTLAVFIPSLPGDFFSDDIPLIQKNPYIKDASMAMEYFKGSTWKYTDLEDEQTLLYRPGQLLFYNLLEKIIGQGDPLKWRLVSLFLHLLNMLVFAALVQEFCVKPKATYPVIVAGTIIFGGYTFQLESVAWVAANVGLLSSLLISLAIYFYTKFIKSEKPAWYGLFVIVSFLCLFVQETALVIPLFIITSDFLRTNNLKKLPYKNYLLPMAGITIFFFVRYLALKGAEGLIMTPILDMVHFQRFVEFYVSMFQYFVFPLPNNFYIRYPTATGIISPMGWLLGTIVIILFGLTIARRKNLRIYALWIFVFSTPPFILAFNDMGTIGFRYFYLPFMGWCLAFVELVSLNYRKHRVTTNTCLAIFCTACLISTFIHAKSFSSNTMFYNHLIRSNPRSIIGFSALSDIHIERGQNEQAIQVIIAGLAMLNKTNGSPANRYSLHAKLGVIYGKVGHYLESIKQFKTAAKYKNLGVIALESMGNDYWALQQYDMAAEMYKKALTKDPNDLNALFNYASLNGMLNNHAEAAKYFKIIITKFGSSLSNQAQVSKAKEYYNFHASKAKTAL